MFKAKIFCSAFSFATPAHLRIVPCTIKNNKQIGLSYLPTYDGQLYTNTIDPRVSLVNRANCYSYLLIDKLYRMHPGKTGSARIHL